MTDQTMTRRLLMIRTGQLSVGMALTLSLGACGKGDGKLVCNDPASLSADSKEMRTSFHYVEAFTDATKTCSSCSFFTPSDETGKCGNCKVLQGPANPMGHCDSFSQKT